MQASLISYAHENQSLSNTAWSQRWNAKLPNVMDSNAGKSNQLHTRELITLKHRTITILECKITKEEVS